MSNVSVVLNCYKRPHTLIEQLNAIIAQTIKPKEIFIWINNSESYSQFDWNILKNFTVSVSNVNFGVWSRFAFALNTSSEYVCMFDDDTIPGNRWLENCLVESSKQEGVYGTIGVIFNDLDYQSYIRHGWANPNEKTEQVDIVGHSWFFHRKFLGSFWQESIIPKSSICGEDMNLSYTAQKYFLANTYVPPHPKNDQSLWGSLPNTAMSYGVDRAAVSVNFHGSHFGESLKHFKSLGFKFLKI